MGEALNPIVAAECRGAFLGGLSGSAVAGRLRSPCLPGAAKGTVSHRTSYKGCRFGHWVPAPPANVPHTPAGPRKSRKRRTQLQTRKRKAGMSSCVLPLGATSPHLALRFFRFVFLIKARRARVCAPPEAHDSLQLLEGLRTSGFQMGSQKKDRRICFARVVRRPSSPGAGGEVCRTRS